MTVRCRSAGQSCLFVLSAALVLAKCFPATATPVVSPIPSEILTSQVTSVSQLSDVNSSDWADQALRSLVERYKCINGYPDKTFQGERTLTRYEFATAINACLSNLQQQFTAADLATIARLQDEFYTELTMSRGRMDVIEVRLSELETNSFSTTTGASEASGSTKDRKSKQTQADSQFRHRFTPAKIKVIASWVCSSIISGLRRSSSGVRCFQFSCTVK